MKNTEEKTDWIWVVVENTGQNEHFVGLEDKNGDMPYIPVFSSKEDAIACLIHMPTVRGNKYEAQAVMLEDLKKDAEAGGFKILLADGEGKIIADMSP